MWANKGDRDIMNPNGWNTSLLSLSFFFFFFFFLGGGHSFRKEKDAMGTFSARLLSSCARAFAPSALLVGG